MLRLGRTRLSTTNIEKNDNSFNDYLDFGRSIYNVDRLILRTVYAPSLRIEVVYYIFCYLNKT
jgi:hypothetical protein